MSVLTVSGSDNDLSKTGLQVYSSAFLLMLFIAFATNQACLFFDYDGSSWLVLMEYFDAFATPFSIAMVDPLQGMFDTFMQGYRGGIPQNFLISADSGSSAYKIVTLLFYTVFLTASLYYLARTVGFSRKTSLFGPLLYSVLTFPLFSDSNRIDSYSSLNPNFLYVNAVSILSVGLIWSISGKKIKKTLVTGVVLSLILLVTSMSFVIFFVYLCIIALFFGMAAIFSHSDRSSIQAKILVGTWIVLVLILAGIPVYMRDLAAGMTYRVFAEEFATSSAAVEYSGDLANMGGLSAFIVKWFSIAPKFYSQNSRAFLLFAFLVSIYITFTSKSRSVIVFSWGYIIIILMYHTFTVVTGHGFWHYLSGEIVYSGAKLYTLEHFLLPISMIFVAFFVVGVLDFLGSLSVKIVARRGYQDRFHYPGEEKGSAIADHKPQYGTSLRRLPVHLLLLSTITIPAILAFSSNPGFSAARCGRPYFSPLEANAVIKYLKPRVGIEVGENFRGSVATLNGSVRRADQPVWFSDVTTDWQVWYVTGNDLRTIGLWRHRIPSLTQVSVAMRAQYFLTTTTFLSEPSDMQTRTFIGFTKPDEKMMSLWGVRYVVDDKPLAVGSQVMEMEFKPYDPKIAASPIRVYELPNPNTGQYSPTMVTKASLAADILNAMQAPGFDGTREVVTQDSFDAPLVEARRASMRIEKGGFRLQAESDGASILVLPVQYSHCWSADNTSNINIFRANLMQLGIYFERRLDVSLQYRFGPFWNSSCRRDDGADAEQMEMAQARAAIKKRQ